VEIARLELADMDATALVHRAALNDALPWLAKLHTPQEDRTYFRNRLFQACEIWGAIDGNALLGFIAFREDWINQLYVLPGAQRKGIGTALLEIAKAAFPRLHAWTFQRNSRARNFYERRGFIPIKWTDGENDEKEPDILYLWEAGSGGTSENLNRDR
jgi:GNAT superfamily N-acetyltransferase